MTDQVRFQARFEGDAPVRINKWLGQTGVCSRREAEALIMAGRVRLDGTVVTAPGEKVAPGQLLSISAPHGTQARGTGTLGTAAAVDSQNPTIDARLTVVIHKPVGIVSAHPQPGQTAAVSLLATERCLGPHSDPTAHNLAPLGRLDLDSRGLLLLSDDGVLAKSVIGPQSALEKEYLVAVSGDPTAERLARLRRGLTLDGRHLKRAVVDKQADGRLRFVLREGRNRQIRRMCSAVGLEVTDLLRVRVGGVLLDGLEPGQWRVLAAEERANLLKS